jgi:hypothetical protein
VRFGFGNPSASSRLRSCENCLPSLLCCFLCRMLIKIHHFDIGVSDIYHGSVKTTFCN